MLIKLCIFDFALILHTKHFVITLEIIQRQGPIDSSLVKIQNKLFFIYLDRFFEKGQYQTNNGWKIRIAQYGLICLSGS